MTAMLRLANVSRRFGGLIAVNNVSFELRAGEIVGLIGPNGAGKTTLVNLITGVHRAGLKTHPEQPAPNWREAGL